MGTLRNKSSLENILEPNEVTYKNLLASTNSGKICHIFDEMTIVQGLRQPKSCTSFKEYTFNAQRADAVFDHCKEKYNTKNPLPQQ